MNIFLIRNGTAKMYAVISNRRAMQYNETGAREESQIINTIKMYTFQSAAMLICSQLKIAWGSNGPVGYFLVGLCS